MEMLGAQERPTFASRRQARCSGPCQKMAVIAAKAHCGVVKHQLVSVDLSFTVVPLANSSSDSH